MGIDNYLTRLDETGYTLGLIGKNHCFQPPDLARQDRARGETITPIERSHAPVKDRLRSMRGQRSVATGQRALDTIEAMHAIRRGDWRHLVPPFPPPTRAHDRVRCEAVPLLLLANDLRSDRWAT